MIVEAFILAWNESETIHLTIKHYQKFCDKITIYDHFSDDGTAEIAEQMGCFIKYFGVKGELDDKTYLNVKNTCYKRSTAKWVIVCDADEILWHPNIKEILEGDCTIFNTIGWDVFSNEMPVDDFLEIQTGQFTPNYCKKIIFNPAIDIRFQYGCHVCVPEGHIKACSEPLTLFHYRNIGGYKRLSDRHETYRERLSKANIRYGLGIHYTYPEEQRKKEWYDKHAQSIDFSLYDFKGLDPFYIRPQ